MTERAALLLAPLVLAACVTPPSGPLVPALLGEGKDLQQFRIEDMRCRDFAAAQIGYGAEAKADTRKAVGITAAGTALGAGAGALIGSVGADLGAGAAIGAGVGLLLGAMLGTSAAQASSIGLQTRYDSAYARCMMASGNTVPAAYADPRCPYYYGYGCPYAAPAAPHTAVIASP